MWDSELLCERSNYQVALILLKVEGKKLRRAEHEGFVGSVDRFHTAAAESFAYKCCTMRRYMGAQHPELERLKPIYRVVLDKLMGQLRDPEPRASACQPPSARSWAWEDRQQSSIS